MAVAQAINIQLTGSQPATIDRRASALSRLATQMERIGRIVPTRSFQVAARHTQRYSSAVKQAGDRTDAFGTQLHGARNALDRFSLLFSRMVRIMTAYFIISTATKLTREFLETLVKGPAQMELWSTQLTVLTKNATVAAERLKLLKDVAIETPLELPDLFEGLTVLQAFRVEISERTLPAIADLAAVTGRSFAEVAQVVGKVIAGSAPAITRSLPILGIDPNEFKKLANETGSRAEALFRIIEQKFGGFAKRSAATTIGIFSNIKDALFVVLSTIGEGGLDIIRSRLQAIFDTLDALRDSPDRLKELQDRFRVIVEAIDKMVVNSFKAAQAIGSLIGALGGLHNILRAIIVLMAGKTLWTLIFGGGFAAIAAVGATPVGILAAIAGLSVLLSKLFQYQDAARRAASEQMAFARSLSRTNDLMRDNINLVDAAQRAAQGVRLTGLATQLEILARGQRVAVGTELAQERLAEARRIIPSLPRREAQIFAREQIEIIQAAIGRFRMADLARNAREGAMAAEEAKTAFGRLAEIFRTQGGLIAEEAKKLNELADAARNAGFAMGELEDDSDDAADKFVDVAGTAFRVLKDLFDRLRDEIQGRVLLGLDEAGVGGLRTEELRDLLKQQIDAMVATGDPILLQVAMRLAPMLENLDRDIKDFLDQIVAEISMRAHRQNLAAELAAGLIDEAAFQAHMDSLREKIASVAAELMQAEPGSIQYQLGVQLALELEGFESEADKMGKKISQALETVLRQAVKDAANVLSEALGEMLTPLDEQQVHNRFKEWAARLLDTMGDFLIQIGLASKIFADLVAGGFTNPAVAIAAIATGIALKAFAASLRNQIANQQYADRQGSGVGGTASGNVNFPGFFAGQGQQVTNVFQITAVDAQSFEEMLDRNQDAVGRVAAKIARTDRQTRGAAYGAFVLQGA